MLFMAHISDKGETQYTAGYNNDGSEQLRYHFHTVAVCDYFAVLQEKQRDFVINGENVTKKFMCDESQTDVLTAQSTHYYLPFSYKILDTISSATHAGFIPKESIIDLRVENWSNIEREYE